MENTRQERIVLTFDVGTQSARAMLINNEGTILGKKQIVYEVPYVSPELGWAEQDPNMYYNIMCRCARLLKEDELIEELKKGRISAFLDVFYTEPLQSNSPLVAMDNVILTPHNAGFTGRDRFFPFLLDEFNRFFNGEKMQSGISKSRFLTMTNERMGR